MREFVVVSNFPKALKLNSILYNKVYENIYQENERAYNDERGKGILLGRRTGWNLHRKNIKEVNILITWIKSILPEVVGKFVLTEIGVTPDSYGFNLNNFEIIECWGTHYNKGESLIKHNHFPFTISFVYYVRTPEGFSPLMIEDKSVDVKEGQCVFFLANEFHGVESNNCNDRCVIAGNILYRV